MVLTYGDSLGGPAYALTGRVTRINAETQEFAVETLINDGHDSVFPIEWYSFEDNGYERLRMMDEADSLHGIFHHLKEHTKRRNPDAVRKERSGTIAPQTCIIDTSKGQLVLQCHIRQGATRVRLAQLNLKMTSTISEAGVRELIDRIADPTCLDPFPTDESSCLPKSSLSFDATASGSTASPRPSRKRPCLTPETCRQSALEMASACTAQTGVARNGRAEEGGATDSHGAGPSAPPLHVDELNAVDDGGSGAPKQPELSRDAPERNRAVNQSSIDDQESLVQRLRTTLQAEERAMNQKMDHLKNYPFSFRDSLTEGGDSAEYAHVEQLIHGVDRHQFSLSELRKSLVQT